MAPSTDIAFDTAAGRPARRAAAAAPHADREAARASTTWFEAATPFGLLRLAVQGSRPVPHAAAAALTLQAIEPLLDGLDDWTLLDADWGWIGPPTDALSPATHAWVDWQPAAEAPTAARLELPWALLRQLPPPSALAPVLRWPTLPAAVVVGHLDLDAAELAALEPGGAVVLPESMRPGWQGQLRGADEPSDAGVPLALQTPLVPVVLEGGRSTAHRPRDPGKPIACEVRLTSARAIGAERLAGWAPGALDELGSRASLWRCAGPDGAASYLASGRLMPWGDGWALALEAVCGRAAATTKD